MALPEDLVSVVLTGALTLLRTYVEDDAGLFLRRQHTKIGPERR
jgi:hypothetical protein